MEWVKRRIRSLKRKNESNEELSPWYIENGGKLLHGFLASSNGKYNIPYRVFSVEEINEATNLDFAGATLDSSRPVMKDITGYYISGVFQQRSILVKKWHDSGNKWASFAVNDIVFTVQMNRHKNVLKVLGCCLDLETPAIIHEIGIHYGLLSDLLFRDHNIGRSLSWSNRLKIANDVANALVYLHTAFPTPIIHRGLHTSKIVIDDRGVAKLVDFSLCIALPPGESQMEAAVLGTLGYIDPEYFETGVITEKVDVYVFGIFLLVLLTGVKPLSVPRGDDSDEELITLTKYVKNHVDKNELSKILDPTISGERGDIELEHQLQAFSILALRCTRDKGADRPEIIDVAKELVTLVYLRVSNGFP